MHHLDEHLEHLLGDGEVGNHAILHGPHGLDATGHLAQHLLGLGANGFDGLFAAGPALVSDGHHRGFVQDNAFAARVDEGVGSAKVDGQILGEKTA